VWRRRPEWGTGPELTLAGVRRLVVVAAHPDDESLGAGGLIATATRRSLAVEIVCATDGEGSHPHSPTRTPEELAAIRAEEGHRAAEALGVSDVHRLELSDGRVGEDQDHLTELLVEVVGDSPGTVIVAPWRRDGHPDHEAAGRAAAAAARRTGAELWEFPVWFWHWGDPAEAPWTLLRPFQLDDHARRAKNNAIQAHASQTAPLSDLEGDETLLPAELLAHFEDGPEHYLRTASADCPDDSR
jgi:LmbE family N-acetylglucosaminyl deacetylase